MMGYLLLTKGDASLALSGLFAMIRAAEVGRQQNRSASSVFWGGFTHRLVVWTKRLWPDSWLVARTAHNVS